VTPQGVVTTLAGSGSNEFADGTGTEASFKYAFGIAVATDGTIYVADYGDNKIRKILNGGAVTTFAGSGEYAFADGIGAAASFANSSQIAIGPDGNIYVADAGNNRIRKIDSGLATLNMTGNSYFTNYINAGGNVNMNRDLDVSGNTDLRGVTNVYGTLTANSNTNLGGVPWSNNVVTTLAGTGSAGSTNNVSGLYASFNTPSGVAVASDGTIYVADFGTHIIRKVTPEGVVTTLAGISGTSGATDGTGAGALFNGPSGLAIGPDGNIYVTEFSGHRIRKVTPDGVVTTLAGNGIAAFANGTGTEARFNNPADIDFDASGKMYIADYSNHRIRILNPQGVVTTHAGTGATTVLNFPIGVAVGPDGNIYVTEYSGNRVCSIDPSSSPTITGIAGSTANTLGYVDATGTAARFENPQGIVVDRNRTIYVADRKNHRIRQMIFNGTAWVVTTLAGNATAGFADGTGTAASFNEPQGIAIGPDGTIYIGDSLNHRIRKMDSGVASINIRGNSYFRNYITAGANMNVNGRLDVSGITNLMGGVNAYKSSMFYPDIYITSAGSTNNGYNKILRLTVNSEATWIQSASALVGNSTAPLYFSGMYGGNVRMTIAADGNVGIGITAPRNRLNIASDFPWANLSNASLRTSAQIAITGATTRANLYIGTAYTANVGSGSVIQSSDFQAGGDVGIPLYLNPRGGTVIFGSETKFPIGLWHTSADGVNRFWFGNNGHTHFHSGNGEFTFRRLNSGVDNLTLDNAGNLVAQGNITAFSDVRSKTNIVEIDSPLEKIRKMRGVYYKRIDDSNIRHVGVIAQEVEAVLPEVVLTDTSEEKKKSVAYGNIVALLIEGMKAQQSTIEGMQAILSSRT
jgi:sugar lactone lactonase YvrE